MDETTKKIEEILEKLTQKDRKEVLSDLLDMFCEYCGKDIRCGGRCHCMNDE